MSAYQTTEVFPNTQYTNKHKTAHAYKREPVAMLILVYFKNWGNFQ